MSDYSPQEHPELPLDNPSLDAHLRIPTPRPHETVVNSRQAIAMLRARPGLSRALRR